MAENGCIGWDDEVSEENIDGKEMSNDAFVVLPDGTYPFKVNKLERKTFKGSEKLPPCGEVDIGIIVDGGEKGRSYISKHFYMHTKTLGMIYEFLAAIGLHKKGSGKTAIPWKKVEDGLNELGGQVKIKSRTWKNRDGENVVQNDVKSWVAPAADNMPSEY